MLGVSEQTISLLDQGVVEELKRHIEDKSKLFSEVKSLVLQEPYHYFIDRYYQVNQFSPRKPYLWQWIYYSLGCLEFSSIDSYYKTQCRFANWLLVMLIALLDDIIDVRKDEQLFDCLLAAILYPNFASLKSIPTSDRHYVEFCIYLFEQIEKLLSELPGYERHKLLWKHDLRVFLSASQSYALLTSKDPQTINLWEHQVYSPYQMGMFLIFDNNLMGLQSFDMSQFQYYRQLQWHSSVFLSMPHNLCTWRRELPFDLTGRVAASLMSKGITEEQLLSSSIKEIEDFILKLGIEAELIQECLVSRQSIRNMTNNIFSFDVTALLEGLESVLWITLSSMGLM